MQYYMEIPRTRQALTVKLSEQASLDIPKGQPIEPQHLFPNMVPDLGFATAFFKTIQEFVLTYGSVIAFCIGVKTIVSFLWSTVSVALTGRLVWRREGLRQALYQCCFQRHWLAKRSAPINDQEPVIHLQHQDFRRQVPQEPVSEQPHLYPTLTQHNEQLDFTYERPMTHFRQRRYSLPRINHSPNQLQRPLISLDEHRRQLSQDIVNQLRLTSDCGHLPCSSPGRCLAHTHIRVDPNASLV